LSPQPQNPIWTIRPYHPGDEHELVALFQRVFGRAITEAHWQWKLKQLPSPVENVWLAVHHGNPIFQYAGIPVRYYLPQGEKTVMVGVDTMTAPEFRRQGLLTTVGLFAYNTWREAGIPFVLGLRNERWGSRLSALGWETLFPLQWLIRPLRPETLLARRLRLSAFSRLTPLGTVWNNVWDRQTQPDPTVAIRSIDQAGPEFDLLWQSCLADTQVSVIRDRTWVNWRYLRAPLFDYQVLLAERSGQPVGYSVYRVQETQGRNLGFIAELLTGRADVRARNTLISQTLRSLRAKGAEAAITLAVPGTWMHQALRRAGFLFSWGSFTVHFVPLAPNLPMPILRDPQSWNMAGGDFDAI
jgi:hypothetical protein